MAQWLGLCDVRMEPLAAALALLEPGKFEEATKETAEAVRLNSPSARIRQGMAQLAELRGAREEGRCQAELARAAWKNADGASLPGL
jgi:hypothetical protein